MRWAVVLSLLSSVAADNYTNGYFHVDDVMDATCIEHRSAGSYRYMGTRDYAIDKEGKQHPCSEWNYAFDFTYMKEMEKERDSGDGTKLRRIRQPLDGFLHKYCRNFVPSKNHKYYLKFRAIQSDGPWCWTGAKHDEPMSCLPKCASRITVARGGRGEGDGSAQRPPVSPFNFNRALIERLGWYFGGGARWGTDKYYTWLPSQETFSAEYEEIRELVFFILCGILGMVLLWMLVCLCLTRAAKRARNRLKRLEQIPPPPPHLSDYSRIVRAMNDVGKEEKEEEGEGESGKEQPSSRPSVFPSAQSARVSESEKPESGKDSKEKEEQGGHGKGEEQKEKDGHGKEKEQGGHGKEEKGQKEQKVHPEQAAYGKEPAVSKDRSKEHVKDGKAASKYASKEHPLRSKEPLKTAAAPTKTSPKASPKASPKKPAKVAPKATTPAKKATAKTPAKASKKK